MTENKIAKICVFCGSNFGANPAYGEAAKRVGAAIARQGYELVYGGADVGLMGVVANAALAEGGKVTGVIPKALVEKEIAHKGLTTTHMVASMHERKALMAELSDGFIAMPGGTGTLEEIFEIWTWAQLGHHQKPLAFLNVAGFYDPLCAFLDHQASERFVRTAHRDMAIFATRIEPILEAFQQYQPPNVKKWITREET